MEIRRVVGIRLSAKEAEVVKKAFLFSPFRNEKEFFRAIGKCLIDSVKEVINNGNSTILVTFSDKKNKEKSSHDYLTVSYDSNIRGNKTISKHVPIWTDESTWNFLKNQVNLRWLVKSCVMIAANCLLKKYSKNT